MAVRKIVPIRAWLGLNQSPDGDTVLKMGEAAVMRNWRLTAQGHLQVRPGYAPLCTLADGSPVRGLWQGNVGGEAHFLAACGGKVWKVDTAAGTALSVGEIRDGETFFFGFGGKVYILTGGEYYRWDGENSVTVVEGYIPLVVTASPPEGGGAALERVNLLTGKRRARFSPDGESTVFRLPESGVDEVLSVEGTDTGWTADTAAGTVTFSEAPEEGVNTLTVTYRKGVGERALVCGMTRAELYNGAADTRVFLYGDGTNRAVYSDLNEYGVPDGEYFPALNELAVDSANTPVTAMLRHYDRLLVFKTDSVYTVDYGTMTLTGGEVTAAFTCTPVSRSAGCAGVGQAVLIENDPVTPSGADLYRWSLSGAGSRDERNAKRMGGRVQETLRDFDLKTCLTFDHEGEGEYYLVCGERALVYRYALDGWYCYENFPARCMVSAGGELYFGTADGNLMHVGRQYRSDAGGEIDAYWESGSMDLGAARERKYLRRVWLSVKPERESRADVQVLCDRGAHLPAKRAGCSYAVLDGVNFAQWSFHTSHRPRTVGLKLRGRGFRYCKLIITGRSAASTATVLGAELEVVM